jgi:hypothetical protein
MSDGAEIVIVTVLTPDGEETRVALDDGLQSTVLQTKLQFAALKGNPAVHQSLYAIDSEEELNDAQRLVDVGLSAGATLYCVSTFLPESDEVTCSGCNTLLGQGAFSWTQYNGKIAKGPSGRRCKTCIRLHQDDHHEAQQWHQRWQQQQQQQQREWQREQQEQLLEQEQEQREQWEHFALHHLEQMEQREQEQEQQREQEQEQEQEQERQQRLWGQYVFTGHHWHQLDLSDTAIRGWPINTAIRRWARQDKVLGMASLNFMLEDGKIRWHVFHNGCYCPNCSNCNCDDCTALRGFVVIVKLVGCTWNNFWILIGFIWNCFWSCLLEMAGWERGIPPPPQRARCWWA